MFFSDIRSQILDQINRYINNMKVIIQSDVWHSYWCLQKQTNRKFFWKSLNQVSDFDIITESLQLFRRSSPTSLFILYKELNTHCLHYAEITGVGKLRLRLTILSMEYILWKTFLFLFIRKKVQRHCLEYKAPTYNTILHMYCRLLPSISILIVIHCT